MAHKNLIQLFDSAVRKYGDSDCFMVKEKGDWQTWSWREVDDKVKALSVALEKFGVGLKDRVAILSQTRAEWTLADLAILSLGGITVPIYHSNTVSEVQYIIENSEAKGVFVEDKSQLEKVLSVKDDLPSLQFIILISGKKALDGTHLLSRLLESDPREATTYHKNWEELDESSIASYVYTSGTTGRPKGAILTHGNFTFEVEACKEVIACDHSDVSLSFLPLAHILARVVQFYQFGVGFTHAYAESIEKLADDMLEVRPHFLVSVPRIFEKVYERVLSQVHAGSKVKRKLFDWACQVGKVYSQAKQRKEPPPVSISLQYLLVSHLVFKKIRDRMGGRIRFSVSGGAPLAQEIAEFFHAAGIDILEGYGLTETTAAINCVRSDRIAFGVVGPPLKGIEEKIAEDGEILARGKMIFKGYYKNEQATREALDAEGWFHTGDIGEFTENGNLRITDRKKDIIVTAAGKNVAPQNIENLIKTNKYISQVVIHGDKRKYLTALITLNPDEVKAYARTHNIPVSGNGRSLMQNPKIYKMVKEIIDEKNKKLAKYETIKRFAILEDDLTQEAGELTPTLKVKRRFVSKKYADILNQLYEETSKENNP